MIGLKETLMRIIRSKRSPFYWLILKVFDILMANSLFVYVLYGRGLVALDRAILSKQAL